MTYTYTKFQNDISICNVFIAIYGWKGLNYFLVAFLAVLHATEDSQRNFWDPKKNLSQKHVFLCRHIDLKSWTHLTGPWPDPPLKVNFDDDIGSNDHHFRYLRAKVPENMCCTACFLSWPDMKLDIFKYDFRTHAVPSLDMLEHFGWVWALHRSV